LQLVDLVPGVDRRVHVAGQVTVVEVTAVTVWPPVMAAEFDASTTVIPTCTQEDTEANVSTAELDAVDAEVSRVKLLNRVSLARRNQGTRSLRLMYRTPASVVVVQIASAEAGV
jgi:hypothetical protein